MLHARYKNVVDPQEKFPRHGDIWARIRYVVQDATYNSEYNGPDPHPVWDVIIPQVVVPYANDEAI